MIEEIKEKTRQFLGRFFSQDEITEDDDIFKLGLVNSLFAMQLVTYLEKEFKLTIENDDLSLNNFRTINKITSFVQRKIA